MTLDESINKASSDLPDTVSEETTETSETTETQTESKPESKQETKTDPRTAEALKLQETLEDPDIGPAKLIAIAKKYGLSLHPETKAEVKTTQKKFAERLRDKLPEESKFLADSIGDAFGELLEEEITSRVTPVKESIQEDMRVRVERETNSQITKFFKDNKISEATQKEMDTVSRKFPPGPNVDIDEYLTNLHKIATYGKNEETAIKKTVDKIKQNQRETKPSPTEVQDTRVRKGSKLPSLDEAISNALETSQGGR